MRTLRIAALAAGVGILATACAAPGSPPAAAPEPATPVSAETVTTAPAEPRTITVAATGDILIHNTLWAQASAEGGGRMDFSPQLAGVKHRIRSADLGICHLETQLAEPDGPYTSYPVFRTPPAILSAIKATGYDMCTNASNHSLDAGIAGVRRTVKYFQQAGLGHVGTNASKADAQTPFYLTTVKGVPVAVLDYSYGFNGYQPPEGQEWCCNVIDARTMVDTARAARAAGARIVIVSMHAGDENVATPNAQQRQVVRKLADSGAVDLVLGGHTHVVQPAQRVGSMWVIYGHGNLLSGQPVEWHRNREGVLSEWTFTEQPDGSFEITRAAGYPVFNVDGPQRVIDLVARMPASGGDPRWTEAYRQTRRTLLDMGAGRDGFTVPEPTG